jgi:hypothetical protein
MYRLGNQTNPLFGSGRCIIKDKIIVGRNPDPLAQIGDYNW